MQLTSLLARRLLARYYSYSSEIISSSLLSVVKAGYSRKCMFLRPTLHPSSFLVVGCNGAILVSQVPMMTLLVVYTDE